MARRKDLPTLPLKVVQTPGGYKAIRDAEDRHVMFLAMDERDGEWAKFIVDCVNRYGQTVIEDWQKGKGAE